MKITFDWLEEHDYPSVTDYCRDLVKTRDFPETLEVYRGDMLCLTVTDIKAAAKLRPAIEKGFVKYNAPRNVQEPR